VSEEVASGELGLPDAERTERLGACLGRALRDAGTVIFLRGELGAGKTTLARAWLQALGVSGPIRSPTYTLVEPYEIGGQHWLHLDLYRLNTPAELEQLGLADSPPEQGGWLVEWPERGGDFLPVPGVDLRLCRHHDGRRVYWRGIGRHAEPLESAMRGFEESSIEH